MKSFRLTAYKAVGMILALVFAAFMAELLYFSGVYSELMVPPSKDYDLVLLYTGTSNRKEGIDLALAGHTPLFESGAIEFGQNLFETQKIMGTLPFIDDPRAQTTDQNARYTAPFIREKGYHRVLLLTGWDHLPRALFLTRFYLMGSGVTVIPYANHPPPKDWWRHSRAWIQLFKFWGSLGRIVLHEVGIDNWPPPEWMP